MILESKDYFFILINNILSNSFIFYKINLFLLKLIQNILIVLPLLFVFVQYLKLFFFLVMLFNSVLLNLV